ncbi:MAG: hypothetical protein ABIJ97_15725 [Bacteroidota bacterium]
MKKVILSVILLLPLIIVAQKGSDSYIEYFISVTFDKIDAPGKLYLMWKDGDSKIDTNFDVGITKTSFVGEIVFKKARVNLIEQCHYKLTIHNDTLINVDIKTFDEQNSRLLIEQVKLQYGEPYINFDKKNSIYTWKKVILDNGYIECILKQSNNAKKANLLIEFKQN